MNKEFKTYITPNETIFVLETASGGASSTAGGATLSQPLGSVQKRTTDEEADKVPQKPRQGPLRQQTGGGKHRDKKREQKQGHEKHRKPFMETETETVSESDWKYGRRYHQVYGDPGENPDFGRRRDKGPDSYVIKMYYIYDKAKGRDQEARSVGLRQSKGGNWYSLGQENPNATELFGEPRYWSPKNEAVTENQEPDHEISMASNQLLSIIEDAMRLLEIVRKYSELEGLEAWQQSKLTKAADYLEAVLNNLQGKEVFQKEDHSNYGNGWGQESYNTYAGTRHGRGVAEGFPHDVDHMPGPVIRNADMTTDNVKTKDKAEWDRATDSINARVFDDMSEFRTDSKGETVVGDSAVWAKWDNATQTGWFNAKGRPLKPWPVKEQGVAEGSDISDQIEITLKVNKDSTVDVKAMLDGEEVGHVNFDDSEGELIPQDLYVDPEYRGQGIAAAMYNYTKSKGYTILRGEEQTDDAIGLWNKHRPGKDVWEQGVAEDFTDDVDNIYAMHPQPEKSEKIAFLILDKDEIEFATDWRELSDPYQQEFGYDLPLWDADDFGSYPNLVVKRITFDQYVQLVGNYIKSEELAGSTMSRMKRGVAEEETNESGLLAWAGRRKHGKEYMKKASAAARKGANQEELGRLKDRYSKAAKKEDSYTENLQNQLDNFLQEKAPEGAKYKRMAKHIKASYKGSGLDKDEIAQRAFGATWKAAKKAKK